MKRCGFINTRYPSRPLSQKLEDVAGIEMALEFFRVLADPLPLSFLQPEPAGCEGPPVQSCGQGLLSPKACWARQQCHTCAQQLPPHERSAPTLPFAAEPTRKMSVVEVSLSREGGSAGGRARSGLRSVNVTAQPSTAL